MTPDFQIIANERDITASIRDRLLSLRISDEAGTTSDSLELQLDDRDYQLAWLDHGAALTCSLGYKESGIEQIGQYTVDELAHSGPPSTFTIRAKAADMRASLKQQKTRQWDNVSINTIVSTIASEHSLNPKVSMGLADVRVTDHQTDESDLHFLTRISKDHDAMVKPASGFLLFVVKGEAKTASGLNLPTIEIPAYTLLNYRMTHADRGKYNSVTTHYYHALFAEPQPVTVGDGEPTYAIRHPYPTIEQATSAAQAKLDALSRGTASLSFSVQGNPALLAEGRCRVGGLRPPINGEWVLTRVEHMLSDQGFLTQVNAETPKR